MTQRDGMGRQAGAGFRMGNTCTPVADACRCRAKPIQYCKVKIIIIIIKFKKTKTNKHSIKPLTVWITINCGKSWKRWEYQTT